MPVERDEIQARIADTLGRVGRVLDVGAGDCAIVRFLAQEVAQEAVGIDIKGRTIDEELSAPDDDHLHTARCLEMDAQRMDDWRDGHFDAAVSVHALHEIADPNAALREVLRVLKPGGTLLVGDFTDGETRWNEDYFTPAEAGEMVQRAGFADVDVQKVPGEHFMFITAKK